MSYTWSFDRDAEIWNNATFSTVKECIEEAVEISKDYGIYNPAPTKVYVGECDEFVPCVDGERVLEQLEQDAADECGEVGEDWNAFEYGTKKGVKEISELDEALTAATVEWLKKYGYHPTFYSVENIREYPLQEGTK